MAIYKAASFIYGILFLAVITGCSSVDQNLSLHKKGDLIAKKEQRVIYLALANDTLKDLTKVIKPEMRLSMTGKRPKIHNNNAETTKLKDITGKWVVVTEINDRGQKLGITLNPLASDELFRDALEKELNTAGYTVKMVNSLSAKVGKGLAVSSVTVEADQVTGLIEVEGSCKVKICLEVWQNGASVKQLEYKAGGSDSAIFDKNGLVRDMVQNSLQTILRLAMPDIFREFDSKS